MVHVQVLVHLDGGEANKWDIKKAAIKVECGILKAMRQLFQNTIYQTTRSFPIDLKCHFYHISLPYLPRFISRVFHSTCLFCLKHKVQSVSITAYQYICLLSYYFFLDLHKLVIFEIIPLEQHWIYITIWGNSDIFVTVSPFAQEKDMLLFHSGFPHVLGNDL